MLYTGNMSLKYLTVPVYTIFKNLTIIVIAYGEVLWFNGRVTPMALLSFGLMVMSSIIAALSDIQSAIGATDHVGESSAAMSVLNAGYMWMAFNVICTAARLLVMKKIIKQTNDWDCALLLPPSKYEEANLHQLCTTTTFSAFQCLWHARCCSKTGRVPT